MEVKQIKIETTDELIELLPKHIRCEESEQVWGLLIHKNDWASYQVFYAEENKQGFDTRSYLYSAHGRKLHDALSNMQRRLVVERKNGDVNGNNEYCGNIEVKKIVDKIKSGKRITKEQRKEWLIEEGKRQERGLPTYEELGKL